MNIRNKTVLITGANRGIGRALVHEALNRGAKRIDAAMRGASDFVDSRVTPLALDVTDASQIQEAATKIDTLDVLINNAGVAIYDDLTNIDLVDRRLAVNFFRPLKMINAFLTKLKRSKGAIVNNLSMAGLAPIAAIPGHSISKAAAFNMSQSLRALLARDGVTVHTVVLGPIDKEMSRELEVPKAPPESAASGIFDRLENGEDEIFPDPAARSIADGWREGAVKALGRQFAAFMQQPATA